MTENGFPVKGEGNLAPAEAIHDTDRIEYYRGYTGALLDAIHVDGVNVKSYFAWSEPDFVKCELTTRLTSWHRSVGQLRMGGRVSDSVWGYVCRL